MYFPCNAYMFDDGLQLASDPNHNHVLYSNHVWYWLPIGRSWFMIGFFSWFPIGRCWLLIGSSSLPIGSPCFPIGCSCFPFGVFPLRPLVFRFGPPVFRLGPGAFSDSCFPIRALYFPIRRGVFRFGLLPGAAHVGQNAFRIEESYKLIPDLKLCCRRPTWVLV